jgi:hypothetical protein
LVLDQEKNMIFITQYLQAIFLFKYVQQK